MYVLTDETNARVHPRVYPIRNFEANTKFKMRKKMCSLVFFAIHFLNCGVTCWVTLLTVRHNPARIHDMHLIVAGNAHRKMLQH